MWRGDAILELAPPSVPDVEQHKKAQEQGDEDKEHGVEVGCAHDSMIADS